MPSGSFPPWRCQPAQGPGLCGTPALNRLRMGKGGRRVRLLLTPSCSPGSVRGSARNYCQTCGLSVQRSSIKWSRLWRFAEAQASWSLP